MQTDTQTPPLKKGFLSLCLERFGQDLLMCLNCGTCSSVCPSAETHGMTPEKLLRYILLGQDLEALNTPWVWQCTLCGRCRLHCPMAIDIPRIVHLIRSFQMKVYAPETLKIYTENTINAGNVLSITPLETIKTLEWLERELRRITGQASLQIPVDKEGAELVLFVSSRELKFTPLPIIATAALLNYFNVSWTIPSYGFEDANFSAITGDSESARFIANRAFQTVKNLGARGIITDSCELALGDTGMGPIPLRTLSTQPSPIPISVLLYHKMKSLETGLKTTNAWYDKIIYISHPCGVTPDSELYRSVLRLVEQTGARPVDLSPAPPDSICCGGGSGAGHLEYEIRGKLQKMKERQLAGISGDVITYCRSCREMIGEIVIKARLPIRCLSIQEFLMEGIFRF